MARPHINIIDTGSRRLHGSRRSLRVLDGAVAVFDAWRRGAAVRDGVAAGNRYGVPRICFVNRWTGSARSFHRCVEMIIDGSARPRWSSRCRGASSPTSRRHRPGPDARAAVADRGARATSRVVAIPDDHAERARVTSDRLLETIAENDDEMMELYLRARAVRGAARRGIRRATLRRPDPGAVRDRVQDKASSHARRDRGLLPSRSTSRRQATGWDEAGRGAAGRPDAAFARWPQDHVRAAPGSSLAASPRVESGSSC